MRRFWERICKDSLESKLNYYLVIGILIPFILVGLIYSWFGTRQLDRILTQNTGQIMSQVDMMLSFYMQSIENIMGVVADSAYASDFLEHPSRPGSSGRLEEFLGLVDEKYPEIAGILMVNRNGVYSSSQLSRRARDSLLQESWYQRAMEEPEKYLLLSKPSGRNLTSHSSYSDDQIMSIVKAAKNPESGRYEGVILLDFHLSAFEENIRSITVGSEGFLYVTDPEGEIIYAPSNPVIYRINNRVVLDNPAEKTVLRVGQEYYQVVCRRTPEWNVMGVFHMRDVTAAVNQQWYSTLALLVSTVLLMQLFSRMVNRILIRPIKELQTLMSSAENGNIDVKFIVKSKDEIGSLGNSFNRMLTEIRKLLNIIEKENRLKREAEFQVLQEQIKPHFLYNTLDTINWIALESGADEIVRIVHALTSFFRLSLNRGKEYITLADELRQVESYLVIQKIRYEDTFSYTFDVAPDIVQLRVLKLIVQPLVENSLYHGVKGAGGSGAIAVSAVRARDRIWITVRDNGKGIPPEQLKILNEMLEQGSHKIGFGLYNVSRRLRYAFGGRSSLKINSTLGYGTEVTICHPVLEEKAYETADCR